MFAGPFVTAYAGHGKGRGSLLGTAHYWSWGVLTIIQSMLDWPVRRMTGGESGIKGVCSQFGIGVGVSLHWNRDRVFLPIRRMTLQGARNLVVPT